MTKIFKQLGRHWAACLAVVALLIVQAYCDLSLPDYTSKIVDTGIQQGGIESPVPDTVRSTTLQALELLMSEDDAALADEAYTDPDADGVRTLNPDADNAALENAFTTPDVVLYMAAAKNAATAAGTTDTVVPTAYDLDAVATQLAAASQAPGGQMLALTLLMVAVAVAVGFIASRVSAAIGRDLRRDVFRTVVGYSNAEIEKFSTASLITRTTNDIQQVQFVCVCLLYTSDAADGAGMDHLCGRGRTAGAHRRFDERSHAEIQADASPGGPAEPCQPRNPDRHYAHPRVQPRGI